MPCRPSRSLGRRAVLIYRIFVRPDAVSSVLIASSDPPTPCRCYRISARSDAVSSFYRILTRSYQRRLIIIHPAHYHSMSVSANERFQTFLHTPSPIFPPYLTSKYRSIFRRFFSDSRTTRDARQLQKRPEDIQRMQEIVTENRRNGLKRFERQHRSRVVDFNHQPRALVLVRNSRIKDALNRKTLPRYYGPVVVVRKTQGSSYVIAELDGAQSEQHIAGFRLIPYLPRVATDIPIISNIPEEEQRSTEGDPEEGST